MTREEAVDVLKHNYPSACFTDLCEAVEIAIQALSAQPEVMYYPQVDGITPYVVAQPETQKYVNDDSAKMAGWICPVCGRGLSPFTRVCPCNDKWEITCKI